MTRKNDEENDFEFGKMKDDKIFMELVVTFPLVTKIFQ